jgi:hypothetical protein
VFKNLDVQSGVKWLLAYAFLVVICRGFINNNLDVFGQASAAILIFLSAATRGHLLSHLCDEVNKIPLLAKANISIWGLQTSLIATLFLFTFVHGLLSFAVIEFQYAIAFVVIAAVPFVVFLRKWFGSGSVESLIFSISYSTVLWIVVSGAIYMVATISMPVVAFIFLFSFLGAIFSR